MLKQKFLLDFGSKFVIYIISALTGIVVARIAGPEVIGTLAYGLSFVSIFGFLHSLFGTSHIKIVSEGEDLGKCNKIYSVLMLFSVIIFIVVVIAYFFVKKYFFNSQFSDIEQIVILLSLGVVSLQALMKIGEVTFIALTEQAKVNVPKIVQMLTYQPARIIIVLLGFGAIALASVNFISTLLLVPVYFYLSRNMSFRSKWDSNIFKRYLSISFPVFIISITNSVILHYGKIMLRDTSSTIELGYFAGGMSIAMMLLMLGDTAGQVFLPTFSRAYKNNDIASIKNQLSQYERFIFLFGLPFFVTLSLFSDPIIPLLMGDKYIASIPVFSILVFSSFFLIIGIPYLQLINGMNKFNITAKFNVLFVVIFVVLLYVFLAPSFMNLGAIGLAYSMLLISLVKYLTWYFYNKAKIHLKINWSIIQIFIINITFYVLIYVLRQIYFQKLTLFENVLLGFFVILSINFTLFLFRILKKEDLVFLVKIFDIKALINYSKNELKK